MSHYRIYIDETGNHDLTHADEPNQRFFSLTGVIIESAYNTNTFQPELEAIKNEFFKIDPDEPVIFHRKDIVNFNPPYDILRNSATRNRFNQQILNKISEWQYHVVTVVLDKKAHRDQYTVWRYHPYHYCLEVLLERFIHYLIDVNGFGDVLVESRGGKEDIKLKSSYQRLYSAGSDNIPPEIWQQRLTSRELKLKPKKANIAGLQLADMLAHPSQRDILRKSKLVEDDRDTFGEDIVKILIRQKYRRSSTGRITGYGTKLLP